jgi:serine/threonine protein kinase
MTQASGTPLYMAPEVADSTKYDEKVLSPSHGLKKKKKKKQTADAGCLLFGLDLFCFEAFFL